MNEPKSCWLWISAYTLQREYEGTDWTNMQFEPDTFKTAAAANQDLQNLGTTASLQFTGRFRTKVTDNQVVLQDPGGSLLTQWKAPSGSLEQTGAATQVKSLSSFRRFWSGHFSSTTREAKCEMWLKPKQFASGFAETDIDSGGFLVFVLITDPLEISKSPALLWPLYFCCWGLANQLDPRDRPRWP